MAKTKLAPTPPAAPSKKAPKAKAQPKNILDEILDAFPAEATAGPLPASSVPAGWTVISIHESEPRYKALGWWLVNTRRGDMIVGHRFQTEAEARAFAATEVSA